MQPASSGFHVAGGAPCSACAIAIAAKAVAVGQESSAAEWPVVDRAILLGAADARRTTVRFGLELFAPAPASLALKAGSLPTGSHSGQFFENLR